MTVYSSLPERRRLCEKIGVACPFDSRVLRKKRKKFKKYQELKWELKTIWNCGEIKEISMAIGALGTISKKFHYWLRMTCPITNSRRSQLKYSDMH